VLQDAVCFGYELPTVCGTCRQSHKSNTETTSSTHSRHWAKHFQDCMFFKDIPHRQSNSVVVWKLSVPDVRGLLQPFLSTESFCPATCLRRRANVSCSKCGKRDRQSATCSCPDSLSQLHPSSLAQVDACKGKGAGKGHGKAPVRHGVSGH